MMPTHVYMQKYSAVKRSPIVKSSVGPGADWSWESDLQHSLNDTRCVVANLVIRKCFRADPTPNLSCSSVEIRG